MKIKDIEIIFESFKDAKDKIKNAAIKSSEEAIDYMVPSDEQRNYIKSFGFGNKRLTAL